MRKRDTIEIQIWMLRNGYKQVDIQRELEMFHPTLVNQTINGLRDNHQVLQWFIDKGCPVEILDLPKNMRTAA
jgi:hypothetical protein